MTDLYNTLGVHKDATPEQIKGAYRRKAKSSHPDTGGDPEKFHTLQKAYDVLSDDDRRARYDKTGDTGDKRAPDPNTAALTVIGQLVDEITQQIIMSDDLSHIDLVANMRKKIRDRIRDVAADQKEARRFEEKALKLQKRFKVSKGENYIASMLEAKITACRAAIANADMQTEIFNRALAILDDASFDVDRVDFDHASDAMGYAVEAGLFSRFKPRGFA
jgi:curved DNA-binding protein CbpA